MPPKKSEQATVPQVDESAIVRFERTPSFQSIYSNYVQTAHTAFDMSLTFGETAGVPEKDGRVLVEQKVRVSFSPLEMLVLVNMINQLLSVYQQRFGAIQVPPNFFGNAPKKPEGV